MNLKVIVLTIIVNVMLLASNKVEANGRLEIADFDDPPKPIERQLSEQDRLRLIRWVIYPADLSKPQNQRETLKTMVSLRRTYSGEIIDALIKRLDFKVEVAGADSEYSIEGQYPAAGALFNIHRPALSALTEVVARQAEPNLIRQNGFHVIWQINKGHAGTRYYLLHASEKYDERAKRLRKWAEMMPYGEMPASAMLQAEPIATPETKPEANFANEAEREAAITRLARIFELKDVLTAKDVQWTQDEERQKVYAALDELIQLNASGIGEAGPEMAKMLNFLFAPAPPPPPLNLPLDAAEAAYARAHPKSPEPVRDIKPLVYPPVPAGSTKTETYFPSVPMLITMGPRIVPFIAEVMAEENKATFTQNSLYALRRIIGSDEAVKKLLQEHAELNEKKSQRLRELRDSIPKD